MLQTQRQTITNNKLSKKEMSVDLCKVKMTFYAVRIGQRSLQYIIHT